MLLRILSEHLEQRLTLKQKKVIVTFKSSYKNYVDIFGSICVMNRQSIRLIEWATRMIYCSDTCFLSGQVRTGGNNFATFMCLPTGPNMGIEFSCGFFGPLFGFLSRLWYWSDDVTVMLFFNIKFGLFVFLFLVTLWWFDNKV